MNHAADRATGEFLLFLHADTRPPSDFPAIITRTLQTPGSSAGAFRFRLDDSLPAAPLIESLIHLRCRLRQLPYGDQGLFLRRALFNHLGDYPEWPVMKTTNSSARSKHTVASTPPPNPPSPPRGVGKAMA